MFGTESPVFVTAVIKRNVCHNPLCSPAKRQIVDFVSQVQQFLRGAVNDRPHVIERMYYPPP